MSRWRAGAPGTGRGGGARWPRTLLVFATAIAAGAGLINAQDVTVRAEARPTQVAVGDRVVLTVEISGTSIEQTAPPDISSLDEFDVLGGPSVSTRFQWINGRTSSSRTYTYELRPKRAGSLTIPPLGLLVQGKTYRTRAISIQVVPGGQAPSQQAPRPFSVGPSHGGQPPPPGAGRPPASAPGPDIRVRAEADPGTAYVGQQVTVRFLLDTQTEVLNLGLKDTPSFPGFWAEDIKVPENLEMKRVQIGNDSYNEYTLMKKALFPTSSGALTIPPVAYQIQVRRRSQDPIESFFFTPTETVVRRTEPLTIDALPLPPGPKPPAFSGAVGSFSLSVTADRSATKVNDALGIKVRISGEGNLDAVTTAPLQELSDFKQYAPKVSSSTSLQGERLREEKIWDYVLIPLAPGVQTVPAVNFTFFDPRLKEYRSVSSAPITIQVARGEERAGSSYPAMAQSDVKLLRRDIHYIKMGRGLADRSRPFYRTPLFAGLFLLPVAADLGLFVYARRRDLSPANRRARRERRARGAARRRLKEARRRMSPSTARAFYASVAQALTEYVADKFDTSAAGLTHQRIEEVLSERGAPESLRASYHRCLEACDYARFAPASSGAHEMRRTLESAEEALVALERCLA
ncbi:MAG TPA: BatD family protein [Candidatus Polarisedimenticolia bacterium]|nr:BatD family protein [Candidatus Polarisedimenticolia bacterium]